MDRKEIEKRMSANVFSDEDEKDLSTLLELLHLPESIKETNTVKSSGLAFLLTSLSKIDEIARKSPKVVFTNFHKILSYCLNFLELGVPNSSSCGSPPDPSSALTPLSLTFNLRPREETELKEK
jgi:hypothetical protein